MLLIFYFSLIYYHLRSTLQGHKCVLDVCSLRQTESRFISLFCTNVRLAFITGLGL